MDISKLTKRVPFGVASPPYQSRSAGTDFEDLLKQLKDELKTIEMFCTQNTSSSSANSLAMPQLLNMDEAEYFLLDELLMTALEETKLTTQTNSSDMDQEMLESKVDDRFKLNLSKMGKVLKYGL